MMSKVRQYSDAMLAGMQTAYGDGFLSPGAAPDMRRLLEGVDVRGARILDLGCGVGGATALLAGEFEAGHVTAADPEPAALEQTRQRIAEAGIGDRVKTTLLSPGPLPFPDRVFDIVYCKDVVCHVDDKASLCEDIWRTLDHGGLFVLGDWTVGDSLAGEAVFAQWVDHLRSGGLLFRFEPVQSYVNALEGAGFTVELVDRSALFLRSAATELDTLERSERGRLETTLGRDGAQRRIVMTRLRHEALSLRGLAYHHLRAHKS